MTKHNEIYTTTGTHIHYYGSNFGICVTTSPQIDHQPSKVLIIGKKKDGINGIVVVKVAMHHGFE